MSGSVELDLWLHEYEEAALSDALKQRGMTVREYLQQQVNRAYEEMVPSDVRARVAHRIGEERAAQLAEREASRRFAIFHIKEHGEEFRFLTNHNIEFLDAGRLLRNYVRSMQDRPDQGKSFAYWFRERVPLTPAEFNAYVDERLMNSGRVTGVFDIDLDQGTFSAVHIDNGWQTFTAKDVCSAAYFAFRKQGLADNDRWRIFLDRLDGKELRCEMEQGKAEEPQVLCGSRRLKPFEISFEGEISEYGHVLNFYMPVMFDPDAVFGTNVTSAENDDYVNVYAEYDLRTGEVCPALLVTLCRGDGSNSDYTYPLNEDECGWLLRKMDAYCRQEMEMPLADVRKQWQEEMRQVQSAPKPKGPELKMKGL